MTTQPDSVLRAMTNDGAFRVITASTGATVQGVLAAQQVTGKTARCLADLVSAAILFRETMAPQLRVQALIRGANGTGTLIADAHPTGMTRGLARVRGAGGEADLGPGAALQVSRTLQGGRINQGVVAFPEAGSVSNALMAYMQTSEQVVSMLSLHTELVAGSVRAAGGYMVQLLPEVGRGPLMLMTERLRDFEDISAHVNAETFSPSQLMDALLDGMPYTRLEESSVRCECWCDEARLVTALATLSRSDIEDLVKDGQILEISCDYCRKDYRIPPARLQGLLTRS